MAGCNGSPNSMTLLRPVSLGDKSASNTLLLQVLLGQSSALPESIVYSHVGSAT